MAEQSKAQIKNEAEVQRIMKERGYELSSNSQNNKLKKHGKKLLAYSVIIVIVFLAGTIAIIHSQRNNTISENLTQLNNYDTSEATETQKENSDEKKEENNATEEENIFSQQKTSPSSDNSKYDYSTNNPVNSYEDTEDRRAVDLHQCDEVNQKYADALENIETKTDEFNYLFENRVPYGEIYEQVGKNAAVAQQFSDVQQKAINDALDAKKEAYNIANDIYWNEVAPCRKNMYHIDE